MKEQDKLKYIGLLKRHISYKDGFWILDNEVTSEAEIRNYIHSQITVLEKDITDFLSELSYNKTDFDINSYFKGVVAAKCGSGKSTYLASLDKLYPGNKFREIINYYLFSDDCYSFIFIGYGQTGKTTFITLLSKILGSAYFGRSNVNLLRNSHGTAILEGKKLFEVAEAQDLDLDTANVLKSMITNDVIYINPKFQLPRHFKPHIKLVMTCNNMPRFKVTDDGIIRRFIIIEMNNKIKNQDHDFLDKIESDIPNIINEAMQHPFKIEDFAEEQYAIFKNDPQWGFGYGIKGVEDYEGITEYDKYRSMCRALGYNPRNKMNFDKFIELEKIYKGRLKCATTSDDATAKNGMIQLAAYEGADLPW